MKQRETFGHEAIQSYLEYLWEEERSELTIQKYHRDILRFSRFAGDNPGKSMLLAWKAHLVQANYAPQTINSMLAAVNSFFDFLGQGSQKVKPLKCQRTIFRAKEQELTKAEYLRLLETARRQGKERLFLIMETVCATGIRISELRYITVQAGRGGMQGEASDDFDSQEAVRPTFKMGEKMQRYWRGGLSNQGRPSGGSL